MSLLKLYCSKFTADIREEDTLYYRPKAIDGSTWFVKMPVGDNTVYGELCVRLLVYLETQIIATGRLYITWQMFQKMMQQCYYT